MVRGNHQFGFGGAVAMSDWKTESNVALEGHVRFNGGVTGLPLADFMLGRVFEFRQATPFTAGHPAARTSALYAQDTWRAVADDDDELRGAVGTVVPAAARRTGGLQLSTRSVPRRHAQHGVPAGAAGFTYPGDPGFPGKSGMNTVLVEHRAARRRVLGSQRRRPHVGARGLRPDRRLRDRQFFIDPARRRRSGSEQRLTGRRSAVDDPCGGVGRVNPFPVPLGAELPYSPHAAVHLDAARHQDDAQSQLERGAPAPVGDNMAVSATYIGNRMINMWGVVDGNPA